MRSIMPPVFILRAWHIAIAAIIAFSGPAASEVLPELKPGKKDKCPVCGMFVHKYPEWIAYVVFGDGSNAFFDGAKDMFKFLNNMKKYSSGKSLGDIKAVEVTDYYNLKAIDGRKAFYVIGSDVYGPMGKELIPFETISAAEEFKKDHGGSRILRYGDVNQRILEAMD